MKLEHPTGFRCPSCKEEVKITTGFLTALFTGALIDTALDRLNREGGIAKGPCGHQWTVEPGSREPI